MALAEIDVCNVTEYSDEVAAGIGRLMPFLNANFSGDPIPRGRLEHIIDSPYHDQLIAVKNELIVGAATMSLIMEPGFNGLGYLGAFVTDPEVRRQGIGEKVWKAMEGWCADRGVGVFKFESNNNRTAAHEFYKKNGAMIVANTTLFERVVIPKTDTV